jgi:hypothetical protein
MTTGGDWLDQARRLMETLRDAAAQGMPAAADPTPAAEPSAAAAAAPAGSDCRWCPLCQAAAVVRGERPEVSAALADVLATAAAALRTFAGEQPTGAAAPPPEPGEPEVPGAAGGTRPVQRIDLS